MTPPYPPHTSGLSLAILLWEQINAQSKATRP